jgi:hypothetical protein
MWTKVRHAEPERFKTNKRFDLDLSPTVSSGDCKNQLNNATDFTSTAANMMRMEKMEGSTKSHWTAHYSLNRSREMTTKILSRNESMSFPDLRPLPILTRQIRDQKKARNKDE